MSRPPQKTDIILENFYVFNSNFGPKEGEEEKKILFYHPQETDIDTKIKDVGLSEAIIKFSSTFTGDDSVQSLQTLKKCQLYYQPEPEYWMIMTINVPSERKTKDNVEYIEYHGDDAHEAIYQAVLKQSYRMFRLFMGSFKENLVAGEDLDALSNLIGKIEQFYSKYVLTLKLKQCDILDAFGSVQYLPLDQILFLRVQNFINMIEATFPSIKQCVFLFNDQVVWSGINPSDMYSIYEYLIGTLFPKSTINELQGGSIPITFGLGVSNYRAFLTGPKFFDNCVHTPKLHIQEDGKIKIYNFIVYKALSATICMFVEDIDPENDDFYQELNAFIGPQLNSIASDIAEHFQQTVKEQCPNSTDQTLVPKFIYFNELGLKHHGTIHLNPNRKLKNTAIPEDVMNLITDLFVDIENNEKSVAEETILKTHDDYWIVKKSCNSRHIFIVLNKTSTLIDVNEETRKIVEQNIKNLFF